MENFFSAVVKAIALMMSVLLTFFSSLFGGGKGTDPVDPTDPTETVTVTETEKPTVTKPETEEPTSQQGGSTTSGTFNIKSYGWGHGVGMSQCGAIVMAENGSDYKQIVTHYFKGTKVYTDKNTPSTIKYSGTSYGIVEFLCRSTMQEIGDESPAEAIKAQAAAIYSFAKYYDFSVKKGQVSFNSSFKYENTDLYYAVLDYLELNSANNKPKAKFISTDGTNPALTVFGHSAARHTTDAESVWGAYYSYLVPVSTPEEINGKAYTFSSEKMRSYIMSYSSDNNKNIHLESNPAQWLKILNHDKAFSDNIGYVTKMKIGDKEISGNTFHCYVVDYAILSHCFSLSYTPDK